MPVRDSSVQPRDVARDTTNAFPNRVGMSVSPAPPTALARSKVHGITTSALGGFGYADAWWTLAMEIVDAQVHLNRLGTNWETTAPREVVEQAIVAMDAVGIDAVLIGEFQSGPDSVRTLPNGARRRSYPFSELAVQLYPERFAYHMSIDRRDPEIDQQMAAVRSQAQLAVYPRGPAAGHGRDRPVRAGRLRADLGGRREV